MHGVVAGTPRLDCLRALAPQHVDGLRDDAGLHGCQSHPTAGGRVGRVSRASTRSQIPLEVALLALQQPEHAALVPVEQLGAPHGPPLRQRVRAQGIAVRLLCKPVADRCAELRNGVADLGPLLRAATRGAAAAARLADDGPGGAQVPRADDGNRAAPRGALALHVLAKAQILDRLKARQRRRGATQRHLLGRRLLAALRRGGGRALGLRLLELQHRLQLLFVRIQHPPLELVHLAAQGGHLLRLESRPRISALRLEDGLAIELVERADLVDGPCPVVLRLRQRVVSQRQRRKVCAVPQALEIAEQAQLVALQPQLAQGEELPDVPGQPLNRVVRRYERLQELHRRYRLQTPQTIVAKVEPHYAEPRVARERVQQVSHVVVAPQVDAPHVVGPRAGQSPLQPAIARVAIAQL